jgi:hypothetical protein
MLAQVFHHELKLKKRATVAMQKNEGLAGSDLSVMNPAFGRINKGLTPAGVGRSNHFYLSGSVVDVAFKGGSASHDEHWLAQ